MYNVRPYIEDCLLSLKRQTFGDFEALCVDDGSTDGTLEAARKAGGDDARFSFLSQANAGQSAARNAGIARATGKYVVFLDSDDYYEDQSFGVDLHGRHIHIRSHSRRQRRRLRGIVPRHSR